MYIKEIKDMITLMNDNGLTELEVEKDGLRIKLKKGAHGGTERVIEYAQPQQAQKADAQSKPAEMRERPGTVQVKSPMVGTFYRSPSPEAAAYVSVGDSVEVGQVLCIIEAMKLMNEIKSEVKGKIVEMQVDNAEPVEFGQSLFIVESS